MVNEKKVVDKFTEQLELTDEQVSKLETILDCKEAMAPQNIVMPIELDTNDQGYVRYSKQTPTSIPIYLNVSGFITFPSEGTRTITVSMNGGVIFHKDEVKAGEKIGLSGWIRRGTSTLTVDDQFGKKIIFRSQSQFKIIRSCT